MFKESNFVIPQAVQEAFVPIIKMNVDGIELDMLHLFPASTTDGVCCEMFDRWCHYPPLRASWSTSEAAAEGRAQVLSLPERLLSQESDLLMLSLTPTSRTLKRRMVQMDRVRWR